MHDHAEEIPNFPFIDDEPEPMTNRVAGHGMASHDVPTVPLLGVHMRDAYHKGGLVTLLPDGRYCFVCLEGGRMSFVERVVLVEILIEVDYFDLSGDAVAVAIEEAALALIGCAPGDTWDPDECEVLWDSAEECNK